MSKKPKTGGRLPASRKIPCVNATLGPSEKSLRFQWRTEHMDHAGPFGWNQLTLQEFCQQVIPFLHHLESMLWADIEGDRHHFLRWEGLSKQAIYAAIKIYKGRAH